MSLASALAVPALLARPQEVPQNSTERKIPCKTPENASMCYWTRGRLSVYNGNPSLRLWKVGTKRILGIYSGPSTFPPRTSRDSESPELPTNIERLDAPLEEGEIFADFEVCPLRSERAGEMQPACIESARNIFLRQFQK